MTQSRFFPYFLLIILAIIWGSSFILMKLGMYGTNGQPLFTSWQVGAMRLTFAGLVLLPIAILHRKKVRFEQLKFIFLVGMIGNGMPAYLFTLAETHIASAYAGVLNGLTPFFTLLVGMILFGLRLRWVQLLGVCLGFAGATGLMMLQSIGESLNLYYAAFAILATFFYGISVNIIHSKLSGVPPVTIAAYALFFAGLPSAVYLGFSDFPDRLQTMPGAWAGVGFVAILGIVGTAMALVLFNRLIQMTSGIFGSMVTYMIPVVAVIWGWFFGEALQWEMLIFAAIIMLGIYLSRIRR
ncbi:MAG: DMT family transporter [Flavobacteriales bacterium]|nr:DMT family transporter [Flavobacteriales bacterium]